MSQRHASSKHSFPAVAAALGLCCALAWAPLRVDAQVPQTPEQKTQQLAWQVKNTPPQFQQQVMQGLKVRLSALEYQALLAQLQNTDPSKEYSNPAAEQAIQQVQSKASRMPLPLGPIGNKIQAAQKMVEKEKMKQAFQAQVNQQVLSEMMQQGTSAQLESPPPPVPATKKGKGRKKATREK